MEIKTISSPDVLQAVGPYSHNTRCASFASSRAGLLHAQRHFETAFAQRSGNCLRRWPDGSLITIEAIALAKSDRFHGGLASVLLKERIETKNLPTDASVSNGSVMDLIEIPH
jgi:hypothetical protein